MLKNETEALRISRLLTPEHRSEMLAWVYLAYAAENSVRKSLSLDSPADDMPPLKPRDYSCENIF